MENNSDEKKGLKYFFGLGEVAGYFFRKKDPNRKTNASLRAMHGVNKFSIIVFLCAVIYMVVKRLI